MSAKCKRCPKGFVNIILILVSVLFLVGLTGITVNGTLAVRKTDARQLRRQNAFTRSVEMRSLRSLEEQSERANTDASSHSSDSPNDESVEGVPANDTLLAKWKAVEMFKVRNRCLALFFSIFCVAVADHSELRPDDRPVGFFERRMGPTSSHRGRSGR